MTSDVGWTDKTQARKILQDAVVGLLLLLGVWLILYQINPQILDLNILQNVSPLDPSGGTVRIPIGAQNVPTQTPAEPTAIVLDGWCHSQEAAYTSGWIGPQAPLPPYACFTTQQACEDSALSGAWQNQGVGPCQFY